MPEQYEFTSKDNTIDVENEVETNVHEKVDEIFAKLLLECAEGDVIATILRRAQRPKMYKNADYNHSDTR